MDAIRPVLVQRMGGYLHRHIFTAGCPHLRQHRLELIGVRCGELCRQYQIADLILYCADQSGAVSRRTEQMLDEKNAGGLAVGAGDADHLHGICRASEEVGTEQRIGRMGVLHPDLPGKSQIPVHYHSGCTQFQCLFGKVVAVEPLSLLTDIDPARFQLTGIRSQTDNFTFRGFPFPGNPFQQFCKKHDRPSRSL